MRKIRKACMSLLTAAFALPAALSACGSLEDKPSEVPAPPHPEPSAPPREAFVDTEAMAAIDALYTGEADRTRKRVNLAQGLSYALSSAPSAQYPDTEGKKLTDGVTNEAFSKTGWVGFEGVSALTVDLDLGESIENVAELDVGFLRVAEYGIELPERVVFFGFGRRRDVCRRRRDARPAGGGGHHQENIRRSPSRDDSGALCPNCGKRDEGLDLHRRDRHI